MQKEEEKPFFVSRVYWEDIIILPALLAVVSGILMIVLVMNFDLHHTKLFIILLISLVVAGTILGAKLFIRKYSFYDDRVEIVFIYKKDKVKIIPYDGISEVFYWSAEMPKNSSRIIFKFKKGISKGLDIEEKFAENILLELKKRNVPVKMKIQSIYTKYKERR